MTRIFGLVFIAIAVAMSSCDNKISQQEALTFRDSIIITNNTVLDSMNALIATSSQMAHEQLEDTGFITFEQVERQYLSTVKTLAEVSTLTENMEEIDPDLNLKQAALDFYKELGTMLDNDFKTLLLMLKKGITENQREKMQKVVQSLAFGLLGAQNDFRKHSAEFDKKYNIVS